MNGTQRTGRSLWALGVLLALVDMYAWIGARGMNHPWGPSAWIEGLTRLGDRTPRLIAAVIVLGAMVAWVRGTRRQFAAILVFAILLFYAHLKSTTVVHHTNEGRGGILAGATLLAWIAGSFGRGSEAERERRSIDLAAGAVGAAYLWAGLVKLLAGGPLWASHAGLDLLIVERSVGAMPPFGPIRLAVGTMPSIAAALGAVALVIELAGPLFMIPRFRMRYAAVAISMHLGIGVLMGYYYVGFWPVLVGLALLTNDDRQAD